MVNTILLELVQPIILTLVLPVIPKSLRLKVIVELILVTSLLVALQLVQLISKYRVVVSDTMVTLIGAWVLSLDLDQLPRQVLNCLMVHVVLSN